MNKVFLIIQREYLVRVKKKAFLVSTLLVPGLLLAMYAVIALIYANSDEINAKHIINVKDESGIFAGKFKDNSNLYFSPAKGTLAEAKAELKLTPDFLLVIPADAVKNGGVQILSKTKPNFTITSTIERQMTRIAEDDAIVKAGIDTAKLNAIKPDINIKAIELSDSGEKDSSVGAAYGAGITGAIMIYIALLIYGSQVMRGVIEEKTNRIIEVIVSSVKPFQLMLGKILGIGMVGLTQFLLWIVLSSGVTIIAGKMIAKNDAPAKTEQTVKKNTDQTPQVEDAQPVAPKSPALGFYESLQTIDFGYILSWFIFYFLSGFMLYAALFAAVGSAVDSETETQQFMFPLTLPLLFTYMMSFAFILNSPDSSLAFWLSVIPFTAPIAMMVRLPFGVPDWQLALSAAMMIVGFLFTTWVAARIYRVGILMYGKKSSYKELVKWFFYKE
ncbi:ABC transporter permease [Mucilaginibacter myungsuensis]|uniref:ABC transporter permease n=1 Tax=Mucilaginibacter myungsuensis TaxID=649104 RepID=A0A929KSD9_9SPHI|nr:ABC transporter permease [Mucilaginibacter myungsuensis]MBE9660297.1 ABC transporter permease [Mucilaginibacter myungsuensis]MDN3600339.1 ABC transporter permease [Mucilaginibacter myungsuensis]